MLCLCLQGREVGHAAGPRRCARDTASGCTNPIAATATAIATATATATACTRAQRKRVAGGIKQAVAAAREYASFVHKIEVEVENLDMVKEALEARADIIMLDNMTPADMKEAVRLIDGRALVECSGNLTAENIAILRDTGVDYLSSGALTHSSAILDLSLKNLERI